MLEEVEYYVNVVLKNQLLKIGTMNYQMILDNVKKQIYSLVFHWNDIELRNTILLTGLEEGMYYEPKANDFIRSFVVVAIRNSYIESAGSKFYQQYSFEKQISDEKMKEITSRAIMYFKELNFSELATKISLDEKDDYYQNVINKYPDSYRVLKMLANTNKNEIYFEAISITKCSNIFIQGVNTLGERKKIVYEDGYSEEIGLELIKAIQVFHNYQVPFITSSFKYISRNFCKLLRVIQLLLECNIPLVSCNYYISNGYLAKRKKLLRPAHGEKEPDIKYRDVTGLSKKHAKVINEARRDHRI